MTRFAEILRRSRQISNVVARWFHTDHWEPWGNRHHRSLARTRVRCLCKAGVVLSRYSPGKMTKLFYLDGIRATERLGGAIVQRRIPRRSSGDCNEFLAAASS